MTDILGWLMLKLMLASVALSIAWLFRAACLRMVQRPSVQLQAWSSWIPLWQTILLSTLTIPVVVASIEISNDTITLPQTASVETVSSEIVVLDRPTMPIEATFSRRRQTCLTSNSEWRCKPAPKLQSLRNGRACIPLANWLWVVIGTWLLRYVRFVRYLQTCPDAPPEVNSQWQSILQATGNQPVIPVIVSDDVGPALCRLPQNHVLILPDRSWQSLDGDAQKVVMRHELAHYRRGHLWKIMVARTLAAMHWFNPCAWWSVASLESAYECMADEDAVGDDELSACQLAQALLDLCPRLPAQTYTLAAHGCDLKVRITRLIDRTQIPEST